MGAIGGMIGAFSGTPSYSTITNVKSPALQKQIDSSLSVFSNLQKSGSQALADYIAQYTGGNAAAAANTSQEIGSVNRYYNGDVDRALAGLNANTSNAVNSAANRAIAQSIGQLHGSMLTSPGGGGSWATRSAQNTSAGIASQAALYNAQQAQQNYLYSNQMQNQMLGVRNNLANTQAQRALVPYEAQANMYGGQLGYLGQIQNLNNANNFYGLQQNKTLGDSFAQFANAADQGIMSVAGIAGSLMGGGGGMGGLGGGGSGGGGSNFNAQLNTASAPYDMSNISTSLYGYQPPGATSNGGIPNFGLASIGSGYGSMGYSIPGLYGAGSFGGNY